MSTLLPGTNDDSRIIEFFNAVFADLESQFIELRFFPPGTGPKSSFHQSLRAFLGDCDRLLRSPSPPDLYFGACPRSRQSGRKDSVRLVTCLWADLDSKDFPGGKPEMLDRLSRFPLSPSVIVDSGNGIHAYWFLKEPELISSPDDIRRVESYLRGVAKAVGGDRSVAELARIMRVPGSLNLKDRSAPKPVQILGFSPDLRYNPSDFDDFAESFVVPPTPPRGRTPGSSIAQLLKSLEEGNRNDSFARMIGRLHRDRHDPDTIFAILKPHAERVGFDLDELHREVEGLTKRYPPSGREGRTGNGGNRRPNSICLEDVEPEDVRFLWSPYLPLRKLTFLDGDPGVGKTTLALQIAAAISNGFPLPDQTGRVTGVGESGQIMLLTREDDLGDTIRPRLERAGAMLSKVHAIDGWVDPDNPESRKGPITLQDADILRTALEELKPKLVIIDPVQSFLGAGVDLHRANETRPVLDAIAELAREFDCAMVCIRHLTKSSRDRAIYRALGSIDLSAAGRSVVIVGEDRDNPNRRVMAHAKSNVAELGVSQVFTLTGGIFLWAGTSGLSADAILAAPLADDERSAVEEAAEFIQSFLESGPRVYDEITRAAKKSGISEASLKRGKKLAGAVSNHVSKAGGTRGEGSWEWSLKRPTTGLDEGEEHLEH